MPDLLFKAFVSCSFAEEDAGVLDHFLKLIRALDIEPTVYNYQEPGRLPDHIRKHIGESDCLIAIATKRTKIDGEEAWACPDWIYQEIAVANAYKKPVAIFYETGVKIEGLIALEERRERFSRQRPLEGADKVVRFLFKLREYLESMYRFEKLQLPVLIRHYLHTDHEVRSKDREVLRCEVFMECLAESLEATHHSTELPDSTPGLSVQPDQFDFVCKEAPPGTRVSKAVVVSSPRKFLWKVVFEPALKKGDKVKYAFKLVRPNTRPHTLEEALTRIQQGTYMHKVPICEACDWKISYPTAELIYRLDFPEGYEIDKYFVNVKMGKAELKAENEAKRIREGQFFSAEKLIDKWSLFLRVPKPLQDHNYAIYYEPPKSA